MNQLRKKRVFETVFVVAAACCGLWIPSQRIQFYFAGFVSGACLFFIIEDKYFREEPGQSPKEDTDPWLTAKLLLVTVGFAGLGYVVMKLTSRAVYLDDHDKYFYPVSALLQQAFLYCFLWPRLRSIVGESQALYWVMGVFALFHLPNIALMCLVVVQMLVFVKVYARISGYWHVAPLSLAHYLLGQTVSQVIPFWLLADNKVGVWYAQIAYRALKQIASRYA